jgi:hypothetical protein
MREIEREKVGGSERHYIERGGGKKLCLRFEGSQAVPACPSGIGNAYYRNFLYIYDSGRAALVKLELTLGGLY